MSYYACGYLGGGCSGIKPGHDPGSLSPHGLTSFFPGNLMKERDSLTLSGLCLLNSRAEEPLGESWNLNPALANFVSCDHFFS